MQRFKDFLETYNFRYLNDLKDINGDASYDTQIIRVYPPSDSFNRHDWFEFGVYDYSETEWKIGICEKVLTKEILNSYVESVSLNPDYEKVVTVYLTDKKED